MSNAGQAILGVVGAVVGYVIGGPYGAAVGAEIGLGVGTFISPTQLPGQTGPRLTDHVTTTASVGDPIPQGWGTFAVNGTFVWLDTIAETATTTTQGGKGGPQQSTTTYSYTQSVAIGLHLGLILDVLRIWENGQLVFDKRGIQPGESTDAYTKRVAMTELYAATFVLYYGSEEQLADPTIELQQGVGNVPPWRGLAYVVYPNRTLRQDQALRHPQFKFEVVTVGETSRAVIKPTYISGSQAHTTDATRTFAVDFTHNRYYTVWGGDGTHPSVLQGWTIDTNTEFAESPYTNYAGADNLTAGASLLVDPYSGDLMLCLIAFPSHAYFYKIDPVTLMQIARVEAADAFSVGPSQAGWGQATDWLGHTSDLLVFNALVENKDVFMLDFTSMAPPVLIANFSLLANVTIVLTAGNSDSGRPVWWVIAPKTTFASDSVLDSVLHLYKIRYTPAESLTNDAYVETTSIHDIVPSDIDPAWNYIDALVGGLFFDHSDGNLILKVSGGHSTAGVGDLSGAYLIKVSSSTGAVLWTSSTGDADYQLQLGTSQSLIENNTLYGVTPTGVTQVSTQNGATTSIDLTAELIAQGMGGSMTVPWVYSQPAGNAIVTMTSDGPFVLFLSKASGGDVLVSKIVHDICAKATMTEEEIDVSTMDGTTVHGYVLQTTNVTGRDAIMPLQSVAFFDAVEHGETVRFVTRGGAPVMTLTEADLGAYESESTDDPDANNTSADTLESALPMQVRLQYVSVERAYQNGDQLSPARYDTDATQIVDVQLAICLNDKQAAQVAEINWNMAWQRRRTFNFSLDISKSKLEPTDPILVPLKDTLYRAMISQATDSSQILRKYVAVLDDDGVYVSDAVAAPSPVQTTVPFYSDSTLQMLDTPLLRDKDDTNRISAPVYSAVEQTDSGTWRGATVLDSPDGATFTPTSTASTSAAMGTATTALADVEDPFVTDATNSVTVMFDSQAILPSSISDAALFAGGNAMVLVDAGGTVEVLQFRDVTPVSGQTVTLSHLLRGRRGTDTMTGAHDIGSRVVLLSTNSMQVQDMLLSAVDKSLFWKAQTLGALSSVPAQTFESVGRSLMPYAPVNAHAFVDPNNTIFVIAKRRARIGAADWYDGETNNLALAEDYEEYEMDVYNGSSVVRTLSSTKLPIVYPSADVVADFGSVPSSITFALYQLSAQVGRGFGKKVTSTVNPTSTYAPLEFTTVDIADAVVGTAYSVTFSLAGGVSPYVIAKITASPNTGSWINVSSAGVLSGTPIANETETVQLSGTDSVGTVVTATYTISVTGGTSSGGTTGGGSTGGTTGGTGGSGTSISGSITGAPYIGGAIGSGDQSFGWDSTSGITSYASAPPGTPAYVATQTFGSYDVIWNVAAGFEGWESGGRTKQDFVVTVKHGGDYPNLINASRIPYVFAYCIIESGLDVGSGGPYQTWINVVRAKDWWVWSSPGATGTKLGQINYSMAWPVAILSAAKDAPICSNIYGGGSNGQGPAQTGARYFVSALLVAAGNANLDLRFNSLTNGASPDFDGLYLDNCFVTPNGGGPLATATSSWDGVGTQTNATLAAYPGGASSLLSRGQRAFFTEMLSYAALCNPTKKYLVCGNFGEYFANIDSIATATANAMASMYAAGTVEEAFGTGTAALQYYKTFADMRDKYYKTMDFMVAPKLLGLLIRLPAYDGSSTAQWKIDGVLTTVSAGTALEYQCMRAGLTFTLLENGIATFAIHNYGWEKIRWYDESGDDSLRQCNVHRGYMGNRVGARPTVAAFSNGVWMVVYEHAIALHNPTGNGRQTLSVSQVKAALSAMGINDDLICIRGTQQPSINTGAAFISHSFGDPDGLILLRNAPLTITP